MNTNTAEQSKAAHTPGPWRSFPDMNKWCVAAKGRGLAWGRLVATMGEHSEAEANAALIAQAPTLLAQRDALAAALKGLMKAYGHPFTGENGNSGECWDKAREAVALLNQ